MKKLEIKKCINCKKQLGNLRSAKYNKSIRCHSCETKRRHKKGIFTYKRKFYNILSKKLLYNLYIKEKKSSVNIGKMFKTSAFVIIKYLKKYQIKRRNHN